MRIEKDTCEDESEQKLDARLNLYFGILSLIIFCVVLMVGIMLTNSLL